MAEVGENIAITYRLKLLFKVNMLTWYKFPLFVSRAQPIKSRVSEFLKPFNFSRCLTGASVFGVKKGTGFK